MPADNFGRETWRPWSKPKDLLQADCSFFLACLWHKFKALIYYPSGTASDIIRNKHFWESVIHFSNEAQLKSSYVNSWSWLNQDLTSQSTVFLSFWNDTCKFVSFEFHQKYMTLKPWKNYQQNSQSIFPRPLRSRVIPFSTTEQTIWWR